MKRNRYDQASRYAAKLNAVGYLGGLLHETPDLLRYRGGLDTRTLPFPGDPTWKNASRRDRRPTWSRRFRGPRLRNS